MLLDLGVVGVGVRWFSCFGSFIGCFRVSIGCCFLFIQVVLGLVVFEFFGCDDIY